MSADAWTGTATGDVAGRCHRDAHGVPTLVAASLPELAYLQGWHVATERAWQVDCEHRRVTGMSAEVFGPPAVANDVAARQMTWTVRPARRSTPSTTRRTGPGSPGSPTA